MTFLIIYCTILTIVLVVIGYNKFFGKGKILSQEIAKLEAENEVLRLQHGHDIKKLAEAFGGAIKLDSVDDIIKLHSSPKRNKRRRNSSHE